MNLGRPDLGKLAEVRRRCAVLAEVVREFDEARDARFTPGNDERWGAGNWVRCATCPRDAMGREVYHHKDAHEVERGTEGDTPSDEACRARRKAKS